MQPWMGGENAPSPLVMLLFAGLPGRCNRGRSALGIPASSRAQGQPLSLPER